MGGTRGAAKRASEGGGEAPKAQRPRLAIAVEPEEQQLAEPM